MGKEGQAWVLVRKNDNEAVAERMATAKLATLDPQTTRVLKFHRVGLGVGGRSHHARSDRSKNSSFSKATGSNGSKPGKKAGNSSNNSGSQTGQKKQRLAESKTKSSASTGVRFTVLEC